MIVTDAASILALAYLSYDFFFRPVREVSAWQIKLEQEGKIKRLQKGGLGAWQEAKTYLLDVRNRAIFEKEHLVGSQSLPADRAITETYPIQDVPIIVYSDKSSFDEAKKVAEAIVKNGASSKGAAKNPGRIYVVKDGFEGLKNAGLVTESGVWD